MALGPIDETVLQTTALNYRTPPDAEAISQGLQNYQDLTAQLGRRTNGFAVPYWSTPREIWQLLRSGPKTDLDVPLQQPPHYQQLLSQLCILIRTTGQLPLQWLLSYGCGVPKYNDKPGALGYRLFIC
ncbi:unnamed protein product [Polarella glacialis]|uniref:Uncharacterized protein n=1 Tax=Polarella glacialis TaxID=89957 RepID=A0A813HCQ0_POLGL|nr:unnamed protein product [Polarella glacialis]